MNRKPRTDIRRPSLSNDPTMIKKKREAQRDMERNLLPPRSSDGNLRSLPVGNLTEGYKHPLEMTDVEHSIATLHNIIGELSRRIASLETKMRLMTRGSRRHLGP